MITLGTRAVYTGRLGVREGTVVDVSGATWPDDGGGVTHHLIWHVLFDTPIHTDQVCGCHPDGHDYLGAHVTASRLALGSIIEPVSS